MAKAADPTPPDFQRGWDAAIAAAVHWHEARAKQAMIQARRDRFPKKYEQESEHHARSAAMIALLSPDDP